MPAHELPVGEEIDLAARTDAGFEHLDGSAHGSAEIGRAVGEGGLTDGLARQIEIEGGLGDHVSHGIRDEPDRHGGACGEAVQRLLSGFLRLVETTAGAVGHSHA